MEPGSFVVNSLSSEPLSGSVLSSLDRDVSVSEACCCRCSGTDSSCDCSVEVESSWVCCSEPVLLSFCCSVMGASSGCCSETVSAGGHCVDVDSSLEVDGCGSAVLTSAVSFLFDAFFPGSYFLPLIVRWSFFFATAKSLATRNCVTLELKKFLSDQKVCSCS